MRDILAFALFGGVAVFVGLVVVARRVFGKRVPVWVSNENQFVDPNLADARKDFPSVFSPASKYLSVIVPAYNEEDRLSIMLDETLEYLKNREKKDSKFTWEILVVDDGSKDKTSKLALEYSKRETTENFRVLTLAKNRGKGGAVKRGMLCARGQYLLMVDADGATKFADLDRVESETVKILKSELGVGIGSRAHLVATEAVAKRTPLRNLLMRGFHFLLYVLGVRGIRDTQCGFKLFSRRSAQYLFPNLHIERWAFDVELIYLASLFKIPLVEVAVNWTEIPGSKLTPLGASIQMGRDLLRLRAAYLFGIWTVDYNPKE